MVRRRNRKVVNTTQGKFSKEEADSVREALDEIMKAMPRKRSLEFIGHFNDIFLFIHAAKDAAPSEIINAEPPKSQR